MRFLMIARMGLIIFAFVFPSGTFADDLPPLPMPISLPVPAVLSLLPAPVSLPDLPSVQAYGTPEIPKIGDKIEVMPDISDWEEETNFLKSRKIVLSWPVRGKISSGYGLRSSGTHQRMHNGIDIPVPKGTPIQASLDGRVFEARVFNGYGRTVILDHGNGTKTLYAHCSELLVEQGEQVKRGQVIAYAGSTGRSTTSHVHFGVMVGEMFRDPLALLGTSPQQFVQKPDVSETY